MVANQTNIHQSSERQKKDKEIKSDRMTILV